MTATLSSAVEVLRIARQIVADGGDPRPCYRGAFCVRCCLGMAKTKYDQDRGTGLTCEEALADLLYGFRERDSDAPLIRARELVGKYDQGDTHTRESALAVLDRVIGECGG